MATSCLPIQVSTPVAFCARRMRNAATPPPAKATSRRRTRIARFMRQGYRATDRASRSVPVDRVWGIPHRPAERRTVAREQLRPRLVRPVRGGDADRLALLDERGDPHHQAGFGHG